MRSLILFCLVSTLVLPGLTAAPGTQNREAQTEVFLHGIVNPKHQVLVSSQIAARLDSFVAAEGARVEANDILVHLDDRVARASLNAARIASESTASLEHAEAEVQLAKTTLARHRRAAERGASNESALESAEAHVLQALASLRSAHEAAEQSKANCALEEAKLAQYTLRAPFAGTIARHHVDPGQTVTPAQELVHLVDLTTLEVELYLPFSLWGELTVGETYDMSASAPVGGILPARLVYIDPVLQSATRHMRCLFEVDNKDRALPAGFTVELVRPGL